MLNMPKKIPSAKSESKVEKLYYETYIQMIKDSVGTNMFRHLWAKKPITKKKFDAVDDGYNSCAYFVSSLVKVFGKIDGFHATVEKTVEALKLSGWNKTEDPKPGDIVIWEAQRFKDGLHKHIGFYIDNDHAISNSWTKKVPVEHDLYFNNQRGIELVLTYKW
jgi:hypothetical protein